MGADFDFNFEEWYREKKTNIATEWQVTASERPAVRVKRILVNSDTNPLMNEL